MTSTINVPVAASLADFDLFMNDVNPTTVRQRYTLSNGSYIDINPAVALDFGPSGTQFFQNVRICLSVVPIGMTISASFNLYTSSDSGVSWTPLSSISRSTSTNTICGDTTHFSLIGTFMEPSSVNCTVSTWGPYIPATCPVSCGGGILTRTRNITQQPSSNGQQCPPLQDSISCNTNSCPINCVQTPWSSFSLCSKQCGPGTQTRTSTILTFPAFGGLPCNATSDTQPCNLQACPVVSPEVSTCRFTDSGSQIDVLFTISTNGVVGSVPCGNVLTASTMTTLGANPSATCIWATDANLQVSLGGNPTILIGQNIIFIAGAIVSKNGAVPMVTMNIPVAAPNTNLSPTAVIDGPTRVGFCAQVELDAGNSWGAFGRSLSYMWEKLNFGPTNLGTTPKIIIDTSQLLSNATHIYRVTVQNWLGYRAAAIASLEVAPVPLLSLSIPSIIRTTPSYELTISAALGLTTVGCLSERYINFTWTRTSGPSTPLTQGFTSKTLFFPRYSLISGQSYDFFLNAIPIFRPEATNNVSVSIIVSSTPLVALTTAGNRQVTAGDSGLMIDIDASPSYDPDTAIRPDNNLFFSWQCIREGSLTPCLTSTLSSTTQSTRVVQIPSSTLDVVDLTAYLILITVSKSDGRNTTTTVRLEPVPFPLPQVSIQPLPNALYFNPQDRLTLNAGGNTSPNLNFTWSLLEGDINLQSSTVRVQIQDPRFLVLYENVLSPGVTYVFALTGTDRSTGRSAIATTMVTINQPPTQGTCGPSPISGIAYVTEFELLCDAWVDRSQDYPFLYRFELVPVDQSLRQTVLLSDWQPPRLSRVKLPGGNRTIIGLVKDLYGAIARYPFQVNVSAVDLTAQNGLDSFTNSLFTILIQPSLISSDSDGLGQGVVLISDLLQSTRTGNITLSQDDLNLRRGFRSQLYDSVTQLAATAPTSSSNQVRQLQLLTEVTIEPSEGTSTVRQ